MRPITEEQMERIRAGDAKALSRGSSHKDAKLDEAKVRRIRELWRRYGFTLRAIAAEFGVGKSTIHGVVNRRTWTHVK